MRRARQKALTFVFTEEVDAFLQDGGLVHLSSVARQHCAEFLDEDIELVSPSLLRLVTGHAASQNNFEIEGLRHFIWFCFHPVF